VLDYFGIYSKIVPRKRKYLALAIWRREEVDKFYDKIGIFGWRGVKLADYVNHRAIVGRVVIPEHYVLKRKSIGWVPVEVATLYDTLKAPIGDKDFKLRTLIHLYRLFLSNLFTPADLKEFKHLIIPYTMPPNFPSPSQPPIFSSNHFTLTLRHYFIFDPFRPLFNLSHLFRVSLGYPFRVGDVGKWAF